MLIKPFDIGVIISALGIVLVSFFFAYSDNGNVYTFFLQGENGAWIFPSGADEVVRITGPIGETLVEIHDGAAQIVFSPCVNQTCVATGAVHSRGQWIACLPNRVIVYIDKETGREGTAPEDAGSGVNVDAAVW